MAVAIRRCYAINRSTNSIYYSDDAGSTWTEVASNVSTANASDIGVNPLIFNDILVLNGSAGPSTPYLSTDGGTIFSPGANISGKEIIYTSSSCVVVGGKRLKSNTGPEISISLDGGVTFSQTIDTTSLYSYPGANFGSITVMGVDFTSPAGGYIAIAGNGDNSNADQIITRTYDRGNSFPDSIVLDGNVYGVVRCVYSIYNGRILFAAGEPGLTGRGKIYSIDKSLSDIPIEVYSGITAGSSTNTSITKFFIPPDRVANSNNIYFIDSSGKLLAGTGNAGEWTVQSTIPGTCVDIMAIDVATLIALTTSPNAIYKSIDGGQTWERILQPTWNSPEALAYNELANCEDCVAGYNKFGDLNSIVKYCVSNSFAGPICKPPYQYFAVDKMCATPAALRPSNIVYAIDQSSSVTSAENVLFKEFILRVTNEISDRLSTGDIEIAIVKWADYACLVQPFTSDIITISNQILSDSIPGQCNIGLFTNHVDAFCLSTRELYTKSIQRPDAKNFLIVFTDGKNNVNPNGCDLSDIGLTPVVPVSAGDGFDREFFKLAQNAKETLAGVGMDIFIVAVGEDTEREEILTSTIDDPIAQGEEPYPSKSQSGNYYYFDGGGFNEVEYVANQIRLGLGASLYPTRECPEGCVGIPGQDGLGYCSCQDRIEQTLCIYKLTDCQNIIPPVYSTDDSLSRYVDSPQFWGTVITLQNVASPDFFYQPGCFLVDRLSPEEAQTILPSEIFQIVIQTGYPDCPACNTPIYAKLTNCQNSNDFIFTLISDLANPGIDITRPIIKVIPAAYAEKCWSVELNAVYIENSVVVPDIFSFISEQFVTCPECLPVEIPSYKCVDTCENNLPTIYTQSDLSLYVTKIGKFLQYPNVCWSISLNLDSNVTFENLTPDGVPFETCTDCLPAPAITYTLTKCGAPPNDQIATDSNLNSYIDQVVRLTTTGDTCWSVTLGSSPNLVLQPVSVSQFFTDCQTCYPQIYEFINCEDPNIKIYTLLDFSSYLGQRVTLQEYPGICWTVGTTDDQTVPRQDVTLQSGPFVECSDCLVTYFQLTNCVNPDVFLISSTDLSIYMGRTVTLAGYPSLCFTVSEPKCDCILVTVNDINYTAYAEPSLFNEKKRYVFETESGDMLGVAWNTNPNQWELFDINTLETYGFSMLDSVCPFSNFWTISQGTPYVITSISFCAERIYNVAPELDFDNCLPCIKCI